MSSHGRRAAALAFTLLLAGTSCGGDDDDASQASDPTAPPASTIPPDEAAAAYTDPGPFPVGITTLELDGGVIAEVWYPAPDGTEGQDTYDVHTYVPQTVRDLLTADIPAAVTIDAARDADVADGEFPLVLFSHGSSSFRQQSSFLTSHLASWGFVVVAPDHWSYDLYHVLDRVLGAAPVDANNAVDDLRLTRARMETENTSEGGRFAGHIDADNVAAVGHSAGGGAAAQFAADDGVAGYASLASGTFASRETTSSTGEPTDTQLPARPSLFVGGALDEVAPVESVTRPAFEQAPAPTRLWVVDAMGHNGFDDLCTLGGGTGIIGVAEASGLGAFLDVQPEFRALGEDGCLPPAVPVATTFPIVDHVVTAWLRELFGVDPIPVGLGPEVEDEYAVSVEISEKL